MSAVFRPLVRTEPVKPETALPLAGGWGWFDRAEILERGQPIRQIPAQSVPDDWQERLCTPRPNIVGLRMDRPSIMGVLNVTPDSFSDGGKFDDPGAALRAGQSIVSEGAEILDIGGESTRPGAEPVPPALEIARTQPVIAALRDAGITQPISIDTRKAAVAEAALEAGASLVNDVAGFTFDQDLAPLCARRGTPVCVMHAQGDPATMQQNPRYDDVVLDVFDFLQEQIARLEAQGIPRARIIADPGIGFGKTLAHNLALLHRISVFHGLGVPILLGASRKRFIGTIGNQPQAQARGPGSIAVALAALDQGIQLVRVHDVMETAQAMSLWNAVRVGRFENG